MFEAFLQIQKMEVPYSVKNKMLGALFGMAPNGWRVVGITKEALIRFKKYDFKYKSGMGINRSHVFPRHKRNKFLLSNFLLLLFISCNVLLSKEDWTMEKWWEYFYSRDKCILATSTENMNKAPVVSKFRVPKGLFRTSGFSFKVRDEETEFLKEIYKKI